MIKKINDEQLWDFSKKLNDEVGVSSDEQKVMNLYKELVKDSVDEFDTDNLGTLYATKKGKEGQPVILLAGHADEIGFQVSEITKDGFIKFVNVGGWWGGVMLSQVVNVATRDGKVYPGVIGSKPPHVLPPEQRKKVAEIDKMFIDCGFTSKEEATKAGVRTGDIISKAGEAFKLQNDFVVGKAWDDRIGVAVIVGVLKELKGESINSTIIGAATVQEEVGCRGARIAATHKQADISIALDVSIAGDQPGMTKQTMVKAGAGVNIGFGDGGTLYNRNFVNKLISICDDKKIPYTLSPWGPGGTDSANLQYTRSGSITVTLSIPSRYIHSHAEVINMKDVKSAIGLITEFCRACDTKTFEEISYKA